MPVELADGPFTPLAASLERLDAAVSPLVGIVGPPIRATHGPDESSLVQVACRLASGRRTIGELTTEYGGAVSTSSDLARAAAIGEALERYSGAFVPTERLVLATAGELAGAAVPPQRFALFHPRQLAAPGFPFTAFTAESRVHFVDGRSLSDGELAYLPAQLVYLRSPDGPRLAIGYPTSNGLACGPTVEEAVLAGLLELVERDAVMLAWNNRLSLPLLDWSGDAELRALDRRLFARSGLRYSVLDGSVFLGMPVAIGIVHGPPGDRAALAVGAGSGATIADAWRKALSEAFGVLRWQRTRTLVEPEREIDDALEIVSFDDHILFYSTPERAKLAAFFDSSTERTPTGDVEPLGGRTPKQRIGEIVARLAPHGVTAYAVDVTSPDVGSLGLRVAKAVCPELCALDVAHGARYLGGERLYRAAHGAGLAPAPLTYGEINPLPHPFP